MKHKGPRIVTQGDESYSRNTNNVMEQRYRQHDKRGVKCAMQKNLSKTKHFNGMVRQIEWTSKDVITIY